MADNLPPHSAGAMFVIGWNVVWTSLIMAFIKYILRIPLRFSEEQLAVGDYAMHGEEAYVFGEGSGGFVSHHLRGVERDGALVGQDDGGIIMGKSMDGGSGSPPRKEPVVVAGGEEVKRE